MAFDEYRYYSGGKEEVLAKLREVLGSEEEVLLAVVFGSFVSLDSYRDVDLAVYTKRGDLGCLAVLSARLELALGVPVDVVPLDEIPPRFRYSVLTKGVVVLERVPGLYESLLSRTLDELYYEGGLQEVV